nr:helix-turn-helix transcriptional regulator [Sedimentibacter sp.]
MLNGGTAMIAEDSENVVNFRVVRKCNYPYIFIWVVYYAWVVVFTTWWTASPLIDKVYGIGTRNILHSVNLISSAVFVFVLKREWYTWTAKMGSAFILVGMAAFLLFKNEFPVLSAASAVITGIFLGCVNISILIPFVFILNNTEKFYAVVGSNILISILSMTKDSLGSSFIPGIAGAILSFAVLAAGLLAVLFFKEHDELHENKESVEMPSRIYMTLVINCVFAALCKGIAKGMLNSAAATSSMPVMNIYYIGGLVGCILYFTVYKRTRNAIHLAWNITFGSMTMGFLCFSFMSHIEGLTAAFSVFTGIGSTMGMINMYYILGVIGKKYNSFRYVQLSILFIGICGGLAGVMLGNLIYEVDAFNLSVISSIISAGIMIVFLMMSPILTKTYYSDEWAEDSQRIEVDNDHMYMFRKYSLSKRETEVCRLLLEGYTLRQISAIISIAYPTVNTYCTSLYRKLKINSRTELFVLFKDYPINNKPH